jgi:hypothetical protein
VSAIATDEPRTRTGRLPCGCAWETAPRQDWSETVTFGPRSTNIANAHRFTRRCSEHAPSRRVKVKPRKLRATRGFRALDESARAVQKLRYEAAMGRSWEEIDPEPKPADFGGPASPAYPQMEDYGRSYRGSFRGTRAENKRWKAADDVARAEYRAAFDVYMVELDAWKLSDGFVKYESAHKRWYDRRAQFEYTGRGRNAADVIERARVS